MCSEWKTLCELNGTIVLQRHTDTGEVRAPRGLEGVAHYFESGGTPEDVYPRINRRLYKRNRHLFEAAKAAKEEMEASLFWVPPGPEVAEGLKRAIDYLEDVLDENRRSVKPHMPGAPTLQSCPVHGPYSEGKGCLECKKEFVGPDP